MPPHRYTPLKQNWLKIFEVVAKHMELQIRFNVRSRTVEIRKDDKIDQDVAMLQKAADFVKAFITGFDVDVSVRFIFYICMYARGCYSSIRDKCLPFLLRMRWLWFASMTYLLKHSKLMMVPNFIDSLLSLVLQAYL